MWLWTKCSRRSLVCILQWWALSFPDIQWACPARHTACHKTYCKARHTNASFEFHSEPFTAVISSPPCFRMWWGFEAMSGKRYVRDLTVLQLCVYLYLSVRWDSLHQNQVVKVVLTHVKAVMHSQAPVPTVTYGILSMGIPDCLKM